MRNVCFAALTALCIGSAAARAEPVDMSTVTCAQLLGMNQDEVSFMLIWMMGYQAGTEEELSMDPDILGKTVADTVTYCKENQEMSVLNAAKESAPQ
ncbi:MAG: HdeA/HdeB family chaperone [Rhizobiaceae bacterium]